MDTGALAAAADDVIGTFGGGDDEGSAVEGEIKHAVFYFNKVSGVLAALRRTSKHAVFDVSKVCVCSAL